jgi:serine/threonine protein kinase
MSDSTHAQPTVSVPATAPGESGAPLPAAVSVLQALGMCTPRVQLVDLEGATLTAAPLSGGTAASPTEQPTFAGHLQLLGEIARGGMGCVLKGRDLDLGRDIAVKVMLESHKGKTDLLQRFIEEAQIAGQLQHPGVVPVYELGQFPDKRPYFTMKLVKGQTLAQLLKERAATGVAGPGGGVPAELSRYLKIFEQVCQTAAYAHARGVIHRDLKPANIMVGSFGEVQVMDWGLAKVLTAGAVAGEKKVEPRPPEVSVIRTHRAKGIETPGGGSQTNAGSVMGTPAYMAPEQASGAVDQVDKRADVFGLGAILCEILTGRPPYTAKNSEQVYCMSVMADLDEAYARLGGCGADVELIRLAKRCLAAEPADRPADAGVLATELTAYLQSVETRLRKAELSGAERLAVT